MYTLIVFKGIQFKTQEMNQRGEVYNLNEMLKRQLIAISRMLSVFTIHLAPVKDNIL